MEAKQSRKPSSSATVPPKGPIVLRKPLVSELEDIAYIMVAIAFFWGAQ